MAEKKLKSGPPPRLHIILLLYFVQTAKLNPFKQQYEYSLMTGRKIVASILDMPYHVLVVYGNLYCSGSLIRSKIVVTTASCLMAGPRDKVFVKVGTNSITGYGQVIPVTAIKMHEYFRYYSKIDNDIALLLLKENVIFGENVKKILVAEPDSVLYPGSIVDVSGWGSQSLPQQYAYFLLWSQMVIMEREDCVAIHKKLITPSNYCAKFDPSYPLSDIGGAAIYKQQLVGILSHIDLEEPSPYAAIFTNITYFHKWILLNTKRFLEMCCISVGVARTTPEESNELWLKG